MREMMIKYLNGNYTFLVSSMVTHNLYDKVNGSSLHIKVILTHLKEIFSISEGDVFDIFSDWIDMKEIEINNKVVDSLYDNNV